VSWETDDNGFIISARGKETTATYRYDSDGYPVVEGADGGIVHFLARILRRRGGNGKSLLFGGGGLAEMPATGVSWETDDNGFIISARGKETTATYRYDSECPACGR
jgi:hypothetical protein